MDDARTVSAVPTRDLEEFFLHGQPALSAETNEKQGTGVRDQRSGDAAGVDLPGLGRCTCDPAWAMHHKGCPALAFRVPDLSAEQVEEARRAFDRSYAMACATLDAEHARLDSLVERDNKGLLPEGRHERQFPAAIAGAPYAGGAVPPSLRAFLDDEAAESSPLLARSDHGEELDALSARLIFAARDLAEGRIRAGGSSSLSAVHAPLMCDECLMAEVGGVIKHARRCHAGRVLSILDAMVHVVARIPEVKVQNSTRKEALAGEEGRAGDGIRSRGESAGDYGEPWRAVNQASGAMLIIDRECTPIARTVSGSPAENREWADRICAAVNATAAINDVALRAQAGGIR